MRVNTQFPMAVHILAVLAYFDDRVITSDELARSVGTNPVVVRRMVSALKKAGLVNARAGVKGIALCKKPPDITLLQVYRAVRGEEEPIFDVHEHPSATCAVGSHIRAAVSGPFASAQRAMEAELESATLQDVLQPIFAANGVPAM